MLIFVDANVHPVPLDKGASIEGPSSSLLLLEVRISNLHFVRVRLGASNLLLVTVLSPHLVPLATF